MDESKEKKAKLAEKHQPERHHERPEIPVRRVILENPGAGEPTSDQALWGTIRNRTNAASFANFEAFVESVFRNEFPDDARLKRKGFRRDEMPDCCHGLEAYNLLKAAAEIFVALQCGVKVIPLDDRNRIEGEEDRDTDLVTYDRLEGALERYLKPGTLPYLARVLKALDLNEVNSPLGEGILKKDIDCFPCLLELIWSYWHEEGMLVQSVNAICLRFQNKRSPRLQDPLANLRLDPLRPLSTLLWGYIQDETNRLTVSRRAYEYDHEYGLRLVGKAVADMHPVETRSKFLEAFHNLLYVTGRFYKEADDTTVRADAFPVLNALKELHLILAQGANNQFGDLPWTARVEMLIQKWLLSRNEIREFLGGAPMVPYKENWMAHADAMKAIQGWTDVSVSHYRDLGVYGEQILLSVRYGDWIGIDHPLAAYNWALGWRPEVQSYAHSYRAVTGVDLSAELTDARCAAERNVLPAVHQMRRLSEQHQQRTSRNGSLAARNGHPVYSA